MLTPLFAMIAITAVVTVILYSSRIPSIIKFWGKLQGAKHSDELRPKLSQAKRNITDNYNHLFELPTLFYATVIYIHLVEHTDDLHVQLAWGFVIFRVVHSLIHMTSNNVSYRALTFILSGLCLLVMIAREALALL